MSSAAKRLATLCLFPFSRVRPNPAGATAQQLTQPSPSSAAVAVSRRSFSSSVANNPATLTGNTATPTMSPVPAKTDYDLIVVGGGSGGMAAAKEAARLGAKVALFDYVKPSTQGTRWGLGGTCVNVGCVPKKLMHYAGLLGAGFADAKKFGWKLPEDPHTLHHDWAQLVDSVQNHVRSLNFSYRTGLRSAKVDYINALAEFASPHSVSYTLKGEKKSLSAKHFIIATGGRPHIPDDIPGARELAITSDDIFALQKSPGRVLCVGGSYISLECAGFLTELHYPVTVAVRSILLRGFDRQCAEKIGSLMQEMGTDFLYETIPVKLEKTAGDRIAVTLRNVKDNVDTVQEFDTVLFAVGRYADTQGLNLAAAGVEALANGKFKAINGEQTNVPHIYAIGDVLQGRPELTPVAIKAGELLAGRLYANSSVHMDYDHVPTTVFTPFEYGSVGLSEEEAQARYGAADIETYLIEFTSLEIAAAHRAKHSSRFTDPLDGDLSPPCLAKLVCRKSANERVVGFHFIGPNAGEVTQGFALAVRLGATKTDFNNIVGIHPTDAEAFTQLSITRSSGEDFRASGGCGGGKCG